MKKQLFLFCLLACAGLFACKQEPKKSIAIDEKANIKLSKTEDMVNASELALEDSLETVNDTINQLEEKETIFLESEFEAPESDEELEEGESDDDIIL